MTPFVHDALIYSSDDEFTAFASSFLGEGLRAGEPVVAVTSARNIGLLREAIGADSAEIDFVDAAEWYLNPAQTIAGYDQVFAELQGRGRVRALGEVRFGSSTGEHAHWTRYESMLNRVFASRNAWVVCPYDVRVLPERVVEDARRTHPQVIGEGGREPSPDFLDPSEFLGPVPPTNLPSPSRPLLEAHEVREPAAARRLVGDAARWTGMEDRRASELMLATSEIVANALRHGREPVSVRVWPAEGMLLCEVADRGNGTADPFVGYVPPAADRENGMGLWIARQMCDAVELVEMADGFAIRFGIRL